MKRAQIESILAGKSNSACLTDSERQLIAEQYRAIISRQFRDEFEVLSEQILRPWFELTEVSQKSGLESPLAKALRNISSQSRLLPSLLQRQAEILAAPIPLCPGEFSAAPYNFGNPSFESLGIKAQGIEGFVTSHEFSLFNLGEISIGVANGRVTDDYFYPSSDSWLFGDANQADANIWQFYFPPRRPTRMEVQAEIRIGESPLIDPAAFLVGATDSTGDGLVGVYGTANLGILSGQRSRTVNQRFLFRWKANDRNSNETGSSELLRNFSLSNSLNLTGEAELVLVIIGVRIMAFRAGISDLQGGFSSIDLRTRSQSTTPILLGQPAGGAVKVERLNVRYCPVLVEI